MDKFMDTFKNNFNYNGKYNFKDNIKANTEDSITTHVHIKNNIIQSLKNTDDYTQFSLFISSYVAVMQTNYDTEYIVTR